MKPQALLTVMLLTALAASGLAFGKDLPPEVQAFRDKALADSAEVRISGEKLKADYTVLEAEENMHQGIYKVADFPKKGVQATVMYRVTPEVIRQIYQDVKRPIRFKDAEEYKEWDAKMAEAWKNFSKPFPETVVCVDEKAGVQTTFRFEGGELFAYMRHFDEFTQATVIWFHYKNVNQVSRFWKIQNDTYTGMEYRFDKEGNIIETVNHRPPPTKRRSSIRWNEYGQGPKPLGKDDADDAKDDAVEIPIEFLIEFLGGREFFESPKGKALLETPEAKELKEYLEGGKR